MSEGACQVLCTALPAGAGSEARLRRQLDRDALQRIDRLHRAEDRLRSMLGRLLLRHALRARGLCDRAWQVEPGPYGKPRLRGPALPEFNLSHAGQWVVCAVAPSPVGIDIEQVRAIDLGIARRFFQCGEYAALLARPEPERCDYFFRLWTAKEAYVKALGLGLQRDFASFRVTLSGDGAARLHDPTLPPPRLALAHLACPAGYRLALCGAASWATAGAGPAPSCTMVDIGQLAP
ncbi:MAG: 4'-phosphopantetheinyl transferase superfamily protein [Duganella sp.]